MTVHDTQATPNSHPNATVVTADPDVPLIRIVREFDATPDKVFQAHIDPDLLVRWLGPGQFRMRIDHFDPRSGGSFRYTHLTEHEEYAFHGSFHEVRPSDLIVQTFTFDGEPEGVALEKAVFLDLGDGRTRLTTTSLVDSFAGRDAWLTSDMEAGVSQGYDRLDGLLTD